MAARMKAFHPLPASLQFKIIAISYHTAITKAKLILPSPLQMMFWLEHIKDQHKNQRNHVNWKEQNQCTLHRAHWGLIRPTQSCTKRLELYLSYSFQQGINIMLGKPKPQSFWPIFQRYLPALTVCPGLTTEKSSPGGQSTSTEPLGNTWVPLLLSQWNIRYVFSLAQPQEIPSWRYFVSPLSITNYIHRCRKPQVLQGSRVCFVPFEHSDPAKSLYYTQKQPHKTSACTPRRKIR